MKRARAMAVHEVLVVASDGFATDALAGTLRRDGWKVRRAAAGQEAAALRGARLRSCSRLRRLRFPPRSPACAVSRTA